MKEKKDYPFPKKKWAYMFVISQIKHHHLEYVLEVNYDVDSGEVTVIRKDTGETIPVVQSFWVTWQGFYPETTIYGI